MGQKKTNDKQIEIFEISEEKNSQVEIVCQDVLAWAESYQGPPMHCLIADPPYEINFMGGSRKNWWDNTGIAFKPETWKALAQHLLPGAFLMAFAGARTYHRLACALEDAGLIIHPALGFLQGQGFPKATRIQDERFSGHRYGLQAMKPAIEFIALAQVPYSSKPQDSITKTGAGALWIDAGRISYQGDYRSPTRADGTVNSGGIFSTGVTPFDDRAREAQGRWPPNFALCHLSLPVLRLKGHLAQDTQDAIRRYYVGYTGLSAIRHHTEPPAVPPGDLPLEVLARDVPDGWLGYFELTGEDLGCVRVGERQVKASAGDGFQREMTSRGYQGGALGQRRAVDHAHIAQREKHYADANGHETVAEYRCADTCPVAALDQQAGERKSGKMQAGTRRGNRSGYTGPMPAETLQETYGDSGSVSRFFQVSDFSLDIAERLAQANPVFYAAKSSRAERDKGWNGQRNFHPTVKPLSLLIWLCRLLAPPAEYAPRRLLIPFSGSGSECIAASCLSDSWEEVIGIESNPEYVEISKQRLTYWQQHKKMRP